MVPIITPVIVCPTDSGRTPILTSLGQSVALTLCLQLSLVVTILLSIVPRLVTLTGTLRLACRQLTNRLTTVPYLLTLPPTDLVRQLLRLSTTLAVR